MWNAPTKINQCKVIAQGSRQWKPSLVTHCTVRCSEQNKEKANLIWQFGDKFITVLLEWLFDMWKQSIVQNHLTDRPSVLLWLREKSESSSYESVGSDWRLVVVEIEACLLPLLLLVIPSPGLSRDPHTQQLCRNKQIWWKQRVVYSENGHWWNWRISWTSEVVHLKLLLVLPIPGLWEDPALPSLWKQTETLREIYVCRTD